MSQHHQKANVAHAEVALNAGRPYEKQKEHDVMYDTYDELKEANRKPHGTTVGDSKGTRIDKELAAEDKEIVQQKDEKKANEKKDN